jgi:hypothetical protein
MPDHPGDQSQSDRPYLAHLGSSMRASFDGLVRDTFPAHFWDELLKIELLSAVSESTPDRRSSPMPTPTTVQPTYDEIQRLAYALWEQRGRPEGYDVEFWIQAERELRMGSNPRGTSANLDAGGSGSGSDGPEQS